MVDSGQTREHDHGGSRDGRKGHFCTKCVEAPPLYLATGRGFRFASSETLEIAPYLTWTMIEATLFLETTPDRFIQRLADYARESRCQVIKHPDGLILAPPGHQISTAEIPPRKYGSLNIVFVVHDLAANRVEVEARPGQPAYEPYFRHLLEKIEGWWPPAGAGPEQHVTRAAATEPPPRAARKPGRRPLEVSDPQGFLYRMIQAQSAEALKDLDPEKAQDSVYRSFHFELCPACQKGYLKDPLRRKTAPDAGD